MHAHICTWFFEGFDHISYIHHFELRSFWSLPLQDSQSHDGNWRYWRLWSLILTTRDNKDQYLLLCSEASWFWIHEVTTFKEGNQWRSLKEGFEWLKWRQDPHWIGTRIALKDVPVLFVRSVALFLHQVEWGSDIFEFVGCLQSFSLSFQNLHVSSQP